MSSRSAQMGNESLGTKSNARHFDNNLSSTPSNNALDRSVLEKIPDYLQSTVNSILTHSPPTPKGLWEVYNGLSGIAYMFYYLHRRLGNQEYLDSAFKYVEAALQVLEGERSSSTFLCGAPGPYLIAALCYQALGDHEKVKVYIDRLLLFQTQRVKASEHLYGKSGYLFALLFAKRYITPDLIPDELVTKVCNDIVKSGKNFPYKPSGCPLMYSWQKSKYIGAAHGMAGILYTLLCVDSYVKNKEILPLIKESLSYLESLMLPNGNWGWFVEDESVNDSVVQWCHGAPGFAFLWCKAYQTLGDEKYLNLAKICAKTTWEYGLLKKGRSLCHGVTGNGYVFLELYKITKDLTYWHKALKFLEFCWSDTAREMDEPDTPWSLFEGVAAVPVFCCDVMDPEGSLGFPGFCL